MENEIIQHWWTIDRLLSLAGIIISLIAGWYFSRPYLPQRKGVAYEKYAVTEIYELPTKNKMMDISHLQLVKSSIKNSCGFAGIHVDKEKIVFHHYGFTNNCIHAIVAPGDTLYDPSEKNASVPSNGYKSITVKNSPNDFPKELLPKKYRKLSSKALMLTLEYEFPQTYAGPRYKKKTLIFIKGIGLASAVIEYQGGKTDSFELVDFKVKEISDLWWPVHTIGNYFEYRIQYEYGPTKVNIKSS